MKLILENVRELLSSGFFSNEEQIRFSLVGRLLHELGWNIWNPKEVYPEYPVIKKEDNTKVDIALFIKEQQPPSVFIEIKAHNRMDAILVDAERQLRDYNRNNQAAFTIITDGQHWRFYYPPGRGEFADRLYRIVDLLNDDIQQIEDEFIALLSKEKIESGDAENSAKKYLDLSIKQRTMQDCLPEANRRTDRDPLLNKMEALKECVLEKGYIVEDGEILDFLTSNSQVDRSTAKKIEKPIPVYVPSVAPIKSNLEYSKSKAKKGLFVEIDGRQFSHSNATKVFTDVIEYLDLDRVKALDMGSSRFPLIIPKSDLGKYEKHKYTPVNNHYCILTHSGTTAKREVLEEIGKRLKIRIKPKMG